ncbi:MAG: ketoacyl-ACP synthase III [Gammaproteobacteria bacterium]|nr:ketoacyl-ACP synthase III [Gammaproteobacteria bacterium]
MIHSAITGTGSCLPERVVTNQELEETVDTTDQWIRERTGILQRHIAGEKETTASMGAKAAREALDAAGLAPDDVDMIVLATTTPDRIFPGTACHIQRELGTPVCPAFDVQAVCSGFIYGLDIARRFIMTGGGDTVLVIGSEVLSRIVDWSDRSTCVLFGDGAGAVVLQARDEPGILSTHLHADGRYDHLLQVSPEVNGAFIEMKGNEVFRMAVNTLGRIVDETLEANQMDRHEVDWLVPHQANHRIIAATARKLDLPMERVVVTVDRHGNTSAASVPLALNQAVRDGRIQPGDVLMLEAFGGGFTWGSALIRY